MQQTYMAVHGSDRRDNAIQVDGMSVNGIEGDGAIQNYFNQGMFEEMSYQTSALGAEVQSSGVRLNMIPKDGSNTFKGSVFWSHTPGSWQSNNFTPELAAQGLRAPNTVERIFDLNLGLGGPIVQGQRVVLLDLPPLGRRPDDHRLVLQRRSDAPDLRAGPGTADRGRQRHQERRRAHDVPDFAAAQALGVPRSDREVPRP